MMRKPRGDVGDRFGKLTVTNVIREQKSGQVRRRFEVLCDCGNSKVTDSSAILSGRTTSCGCGRIKHGKSRTKEYRMFIDAKERAIQEGLPFDIELDDVVIPCVCPLLGIDIHKDSEKLCDNSPSLDKLIPSKGYVKGNVLVVSYKANRIKSNASIDELMTLTENLHNILIK